MSSAACDQREVKHRMAPDNAWVPVITAHICGSSALLRVQCELRQMTRDTQWRNNFIFATLGSCLELEARQVRPIEACADMAGLGARICSVLSAQSVK